MTIDENIVFLSLQCVVLQSFYVYRLEGKSASGDNVSQIVAACGWTSVANGRRMCVRVCIRLVF